MDSIYIYALQTLLSFVGAIIGGSLTLAGVIMANRLNAKENRENLRLENMPYLVFTGYIETNTNKVDHLKHRKPIETNVCIAGLEVKNFGKGTLKNLEMTIYKKGNPNPYTINRYQFMGLNEIINIDLFKAKLTGESEKETSLRDFDGIEFKNLRTESEFLYTIKIHYKDVYDNPYKQEVTMVYFIETGIEPIFSFADVESCSGPTFCP
jgi:hypothetical protein